MSVDDKIFWMVVTMPIIPCILSFILGGVTGVIIMSFLDAINEFKEPLTAWRDESEGDEDGF